MSTKHSDDELLQELHNLAEELGQTPTAIEMNEQGRFFSSRYCDRFGSWNNALRAADLKVNQVGHGQISDEQLRISLQDLADDLGRTPTAVEMNEQGRYSSTTYCDRFGSWNNALRAADLKMSQGRNRSPDISQEELLNALRELAEELGETPTGPKMDKQGQFSSPTYVRRFGGWDDALQAAGFEPNEPVEISKNKLIEALQDLADELGRAPKTTEMAEQGPYSTSPYYNRFGNWDDALEAAGLLNTAP